MNKISYILPIKAVLLSALLSQVIFASPTENKSINNEMEELFGPSPIVVSTFQDTVSVPANNDALFIISDISQDTSPVTNAAIDTTPIQETLVLSEKKRTENFAVALEPNYIHYTIPNSFDDVKIELLALDGAVISEVKHTASEVGGTFDTADLNDGYYIVRILDSTGKAFRVARAVAIKH